MRLDKLLAQEKISRKAMKQALLKKEILVDGQEASSLAQNTDTGLQELIFQGRRIQGYEHTYLMLHKPNGVVTASKDKELQTVMDLLPKHLQSEQLYAIGRLDRDTTGLLLLTNNGPLGFQLLHSQYRRYCNFCSSLYFRCHAIHTLKKILKSYSFKAFLFYSLFSK